MLQNAANLQQKRSPSASPRRSHSLIAGVTAWYYNNEKKGLQGRIKRGETQHEPLLLKYFQSYGEAEKK